MINVFDDQEEKKTAAGTDQGGAGGTVNDSQQGGQTGGTPGGDNSGVPGGDGTTGTQQGDRQKYSDAWLADQDADVQAAFARSSLQGGTGIIPNAKPKEEQAVTPPSVTETQEGAVAGSQQSEQEIIQPQQGGQTVGQSDNAGVQTEHTDGQTANTVVEKQADDTVVEKKADGTDGEQAGEQKAAYLANWDDPGVNIATAWGQGGHSAAELFADRNRWAKENGKEPTDYTELMMLATNHDLSKSKAQEEEEIRQAKRKEAFNKIGNAFLHIGNFVGTLHGAPSQRLPQADELTKRQQLLRDRTLAERDKANKMFLDAIYKDRLYGLRRDKNDADIRKTDQNIENMQNDSKRKDALNEANIGKVKSQQQQHESVTEYNKERSETERQTRQPKIDKLQTAADANRASANQRNSSAGANAALAEKRRSDIGKGKTSKGKTEKKKIEY